jgi:cytoskeletal protein CcmA (bactofilin family)
MQVVRGTLDAPLCVTDALAVHGTVTGPVRVMSTAELVLRGVCKGDIVVAPGARAEIWGIVEGNVINQGGDVYLSGLVEGYVDRAAGHTDVAPDFRAKRGFSS